MLTCGAPVLHSECNYLTFLTHFNHQMAAALVLTPVRPRS